MESQSPLQPRGLFFVVVKWILSSSAGTEDKSEFDILASGGNFRPSSVADPNYDHTLLAKLKDDEGLQEKLKDAANPDAFLAVAKEAGFDISKAAWLRFQAKQTIELSDEELEEVAGGKEWWYGLIGFPGEMIARGVKGDWEFE